MSAKRGNRVELKTFKNWGTAVQSHIGYKTEQGDDGRTYVSHVWCKLCAEYKHQIVGHPNLRGAAKKSFNSYAIGTNSVTKSNTRRHLEGKAHSVALLLHSGSETPTNSGVTSTVSKLAKTCVLRLTRDKLYFILSEKAVSGEVQIWCELTQHYGGRKHSGAEGNPTTFNMLLADPPTYNLRGSQHKLDLNSQQSHFFDEYAMEGLSVEDANEIYLDLIPENLVKALRSSQSAKWVKLKLTKKQTPCLSVEVSLPSLTGHDRLVVHDIPVNVIPKRLWDEFDEPELPKFDVSICMPHWKLLRNIVDKMKNLSNFVVIAANGSGELRLMVETDMASVSTHFRDLTNATWNKDDEGKDAQGDSPVVDPQQFVEARVDIRKFAQFLAGQQVNPYKIICNIVHNTTLHFFMLHEDVSLQYFMPVVQS